MPATRVLLAAAVLALAACAPLPQRAGIPTDWHPSPNFNERKPNYVVLHYTTDDTADEAIATLTSPLAAVSAHYLVGRDGAIVQLVDERMRAWHAGDSRWGASTDLNSSSIGIELDNDGKSPFPDVQIEALVRLLRDVVDRYRIPPANVLGHADVAPRRKADPGPLFPWRTLARAGFGAWCEPPPAQAPEGFDFVLGLRAFGYDTTDLGAAVRAFRAHFLPDDGSDGIGERARATLYCLVRETAPTIAARPGRP